MSSLSENDTLSSSSDENTNGDEELRLSVKESSHSTVDVMIAPSLTISEVKQVVREALGETEQRYIRLICKGRLLAPDSASIREFNLREGDVLHAVMAAAGVRGGQQAALARGTTRRYRGTGVDRLGRVVRSGEDETSDDEADDDVEDGRERLGFDRLRSSGLSGHEITAIRSYFSPQVDRYVEEDSSVGEQESDLVRRRLMQEDAWMQSQGPASEFRLNLNQNNPLVRFSTTGSDFFPSRMGSDRDFVWGFLLGFFVGMLMLVWVWIPTVPHKQKLGILTGISLQIAFSLLKNQGDSDSPLDDTD